MTLDADDARWVRDRLRDPGSTRVDGDLGVAIAELIRERRPLLGDAAVREAAARLHADLTGLGPIADLLRDDAVTDVLINGEGPVWVERDGRLERTSVSVDDAAIARLVAATFGANGLNVDRSHPVGDTRLPSGERVSVVVPPVAIGGIHVAIRRFAERPLGLEAFGDPGLVDRLRRIVHGRANVVVFGATGSGKTSLVAAMAGQVPPDERLVTIEDAAELCLPASHVVRLECRPHNGEGAGRVDLRSLVRAALRLRPDRIVVGEVRGPEALDMIWALATGHAGSLSTCHARTPAEVLSRLETFVLLADAALPLAAVRAQVRTAIDVVVGVARHGDRRAVTSVDRVVDDPNHPSGVEPLWRARAVR